MDVSGSEAAWDEPVNDPPIASDVKNRSVANAVYASTAKIALPSVRYKATSKICHTSDNALLKALRSVVQACPYKSQMLASIPRGLGLGVH